jgi:hypothetical protein
MTASPQRGVPEQRPSYLGCVSNVPVFWYVSARSLRAPAYTKTAESMPQPNEPLDLPSRIARLEAIEAVRDVKSNYARLADRVLGSPSLEAATALADLFTDDAVADYGPFFGKFTGRAELLNAFQNVLPAGTRWSAHYIVNGVVDVSGDTAEGRFSFLIHAKPATPADASLVTFYGTYEEKFRRVASAWRISELSVTYASPPG